MKRLTVLMIAAFCCFAMNGSLVFAQATFSENFNGLSPLGNMIGTYTGWYDGGSGPVVTSGNGVAGSVGLAPATNIFTWSGHPFNWNDADFQEYIVQMDFQSDGSGNFDDDRIGWMTTTANVTSSNFFGVQLDPIGDSGPGQNIETYWRNAATTRIEQTIVTLPSISANTWYRFRAEITKLSATSARIDVTLTQLDGSGNPGTVVATGSVTNTDSFGADAPPATYFNPTSVYPAFKNFTSAGAPADNAYFQTLTSGVQYALDVSVVGSGSVTKNPDKATYNSGEVVHLTAVPQSGNAFDHWTGDLTGTTNPTTITMDGNKSVTATFVPSSAQYTLTISTVGNGSVTKNPDQATYTSGQSVQITAVPTSGWTFSSWSGGLSGNTNPATIIMDANKTITATFVDQGLVGYWKFDETSGTTAYDASTHGLNGTVNSATWATGKVNGALQFDGASSYVDLGNPTLLQSTGSMTWSAWVRAVANPSDDGQIIAKSDGTAGWEFKSSPDTGPHTFAVAVFSSGGGYVGRYSTTVRALNTWYHVAGVYNATAQTLNIYVNGALDNGTLMGTVPSSSSPSSVNVNVGRRSGGYYFNGLIDDARIYNRALSQSEIQALMNPGPPQYSLTINVLGSGTVTRNPSLALYDSAQVVTLTATPAEGWQFSGWSGGLTGTMNPSTISMTSNKSVTATFMALPGAETISFVSYGDFGDGGTNAEAVANLIKSLNPGIILTNGDNNYSGNGTTAGWDNVVGKFYGQQYIHYPAGSTSAYAPGPAENAFFPSIGNHDMDLGLTSQSAYFDLPPNERYYTFVRGPVQFFAIDADSREPDGTSSSSTQAQWLQAQLAASTAPWKVVYMHQPPYSSGTTHGSTAYMQWPYEQWGADAVIGGHEHHYERIIRDENADGKNIAYLISGAGGHGLYTFGTPVAGSQFRYNAAYGALFVEATATSMSFKFYSLASPTVPVDSYTMLKETSPGTYLEDFNTFTVDQTVGSHTGWYDGSPSSGPIVRADNGVPNSSGQPTQGLDVSGTVFTWSAHPFVWNDAALEAVILGMDFRSDANGQFDDDRVCWNINQSADSRYNFGVQLDNANSTYAVTTYWRGSIANDAPRIQDPIVSLTDIQANSWYRLRATITKLTSTSASINVLVSRLDANGDPIGTPLTGVVPNTSTWTGGAPDPNYFSAGVMWPAFKNHTGAPGPADNAYLEIVEAPPGPDITITGTPLGPFTSTAGTPSAQQSYSVSGSNLTENITVTAPADFEISMTSGSNFTSTTTLTQSGGIVPPTTIYVRFNRATAGTSTGNIIHTSTGATTENVAVTGTASPSTPGGSVKFAAFGDFGDPNANGGVTEQAVADLVVSKAPDLIITMGDNNYLNNSSTATWDATNGDFYYPFIKYPTGSTSSHASNGVTVNKYFPAFGNHDWDAGGETEYFDLPGNERYYTFTEGPVQFFCIDSDTREPDGTSSSSTQGQWLQSQLAASTSAWKIVYEHHPPFSSGSTHGSTPYMQWPYEDWGADAVLSGHDHVYERIVRDDNTDGKDIAYVINGAGGKSLYSFGTPVAGSEVRIGFDGSLNNYGTIITTATSQSITFEFWTIQNGGTLRDSYTMTKPSEMVCETFDGFTVGQTVGADANWYDGGSGPTIDATSGVNGSQGLGASGTIFTWIAHPFDWTSTDFEAVKLQMDFKTDANGDFDDDRVGWMINDNSTNSDYIFGVQLDNASAHLRMEGYWDHIQGDDAGRVEMANLNVVTINPNSWYQLHAEIRKLGATSAHLYGELWSLDASGTRVSLIASGSIPNTDLVGSTVTPRAEYFTGPIWPAFKNHSGAAAPADNACFEVISGSSTNPLISVTGIPLLPFTSDPGVNSTEQSYAVTGANLTTGITVTAPTDFQVSASSGGPYSSSITLGNSGGTVFVIFNRATTGVSSGSITHTSNGATQVNVGVTGTVANPTLTFREGVGGYSGTLDTYLSQAEPALAHGAEDSFLWDTDDPSGSGQYLYGLIRFDNLFGSGAGQIPAGSTIQSAILTYTIFNEGNEADVNEVAIDWTTNETWNGFGTSAGVQAEDYGNLVGSTTGSIPVGTKQFDVTSSLSAWSLSPSDNHGWIFRPTGTNGVDIRSSEYATTGERPLLTVEYIPPTGPSIHTSATSLTPFTADIGVPSAEQSYVVSGANLTNGIALAAPADFEISLSSGTGFTDIINLTQTGGVVPSTTIYVRFNRTTAGTSTGNIAHTSAGATTRNVAVSGTASEPSTTIWTAYNDCVYRSSDQYTGANVTQFGIGTGFTGSTSGLLLNQTTGASTGITATLTQSGGVVWQPDPASGGHDPNAGTDAYSAFHGIADMTGVIYYGSLGWWVDLTFTGLDPTKQYTFATSAARCNSAADYANRNTIYTLTGADSYTNSSTSGVTEISPNSVKFNTGDNQTQGYVARWTNISTGTDGTFKVRATGDASDRPLDEKAYAFSVFMLQELAGVVNPPHTITATAGANGSISPAGAVSVADGANQTFTMSPATGFQVATLKIDGVGVEPSTSHTFTNVTADHTIDAAFSLAGVAVSSVGPVYDFDTNGDPLTTEIAMTFATLPAGGGTVSVTAFPVAPPLPPENVIPYYWQITSTLTSHAFSATISIDMTGVPGFVPGTSYLMYYNATSASWVMVNGTYAAPWFTFTTDHFTPYTFVNPESTPANLFVSASATSAVAGVIYPNTDWGTTSYDPNDWQWTGSQSVSVYVVPQNGAIFGACDITFEWSGSNLLFSGVDFGTPGSSGDPNGLFSPSQSYPTQGSFSQLGTTNRLRINASRLDLTNFTTNPGDYIARINFTLTKPGHSDVSVIAADVRAWNQEAAPSTVYVVPFKGDVKAYLGDVASAPSFEGSGDGRVDYDDLSPWSLAYWSGTPGYGLGAYKLKYDIGPTQNLTVFSLPIPDTKIDFEDLVIFSLSYGLSATHQLPKLPAIPKEPVEVSLGKPVLVGNETRIPLLVDGAVVDVRALSFEITGQFDSFLGVEKGTLLQDYTNPVALMSKSAGRTVSVDFAIMGLENEAIASSGEVALLRFQGTPHVQLKLNSARSSGNTALALKKKIGEGESQPTTYSLLQNYPNPFNPVTTIEYQLPAVGQVRLEVFSVLGERVATLVNEVQDAGYYSLHWNGTDQQGRQVASGMYIYRLVSGTFTSVKRMMLLK